MNARRGCTALVLYLIAAVVTPFALIFFLVVLGGTDSSTTSTSLSAAVQKDIGSDQNELAVAQFLVDNGYSKAAAAGVAGCVAGESGGNPEAVGNGDAGGLIQWTPMSKAAPNPNIITGDAAKDMKTQLADLLYYNSAQGQSLVNQFNAISDPVIAADFYSENFERPRIALSDVRPSVAQQVFSELGG